MAFAGKPPALISFAARSPCLSLRSTCRPWFTTVLTAVSGRQSRQPLLAASFFPLAGAGGFAAGSPGPPAGLGYFTKPSLRPLRLGFESAPGSEVRFIGSRDASFPAILGHEVVSQVEWVPPDSGWQKRDRVAIDSVLGCQVRDLPPVVSVPRDSIICANALPGDQWPRA